MKDFREVLEGTPEPRLAIRLAIPSLDEWHEKGEATWLRLLGGQVALAFRPRWFEPTRAVRKLRPPPRLRIVRRAPLRNAASR